MKYILRYSLILFAMTLCMALTAQTTQTGKWKEMHKVKRGETVFGIARDYGLTIQELIKANPEMNTKGYTLKKGTYIFIPYPADVPEKQKAESGKAVLRVGIMLPLHDVDGDGRRMVEYYRGILMACEQLKKEGFSTDIHAWNVNIDADIKQTLLAQGANRCDIIFGPLYTKQVAALSEFARAYNIKVVIPFSISGNDVQQNPNIFQVYQSPEKLNDAAIDQFLARFSKYHPVFVDCNDKESKKGIFTFGLRKQLEKRGIEYSITNITSSEELFAKAFSLAKPNIVILNTGRSPELNGVLKKLDAFTARNNSVSISLFGYTEWLMYEKYNINKFFQYDTYIPSSFYYNAISAKTQQIEQAYRRNFNASMMDAVPRFAITGYDHAMFFLRGMNAKGKDFDGSAPSGSVIQTPLRFVRVSKKGGMQNNSFLFVHYNRNKSISTINF